MHFKVVVVVVVRSAGSTILGLKNHFPPCTFLLTRHLYAGYPLVGGCRDKECRETRPTVVRFWDAHYIKHVLTMSKIQKRLKR